MPRGAACVFSSFASVLSCLAEQADETCGAVDCCLARSYRGKSGPRSYFSRSSDNLRKPVASRNWLDIRALPFLRLFPFMATPDAYFLHPQTLIAAWCTTCLNPSLI
jgi:hypothetical protein